jgi:hypothetical protein
MRPIARANSAARMKLMHRIYALAQPSNRHTNFDDVREVAHDGLGARSALVACHDAFKKTRCLVLRCGHSIIPTRARYRSCKLNLSFAICLQNGAFAENL